MRSIALACLLFLVLPLAAQERRYTVDTEPALTESWKVLRYLRNGTRPGSSSDPGAAEASVHALRRGDLMRDWQTVYRGLPRDMQQLIGPCMAAVPRVIQLIVDAWELIRHARENEHGRQRSATIERANKLLADAAGSVDIAVACWFDAKREYARRGGRQKEGEDDDGPDDPDLPPPLELPNVRDDCRRTSGIQKLRDLGYTLEPVSSRNLEFAIAKDDRPPKPHKPYTHTRPTAEELGMGRIVSSGSYTGDGVRPVGPLYLRTTLEIATNIQNRTFHKARLKPGGDISGRGGVWVIANGPVLVRRQPGLSEGDIRGVGNAASFMGGGALIIENGREIGDDDLAGRQGFFEDAKRGFAAGQLSSPANRIVFGDCAGEVYWMATPNAPAKEVQKALLNAKFTNVVVFDGGNGGFAYRKGKVIFNGRGNHEGDNVLRVFIR